MYFPSIQIVDTREEMIAITIFSCVAILLSAVLLVLVRMVCRRYSCVTNSSATSEAKTPSEDMLEVNMGVDLTAITPTSAVTVLSSPSNHHCSSIEVRSLSCGSCQPLLLVIHYVKLLYSDQI